MEGVIFALIGYMPALSHMVALTACHSTRLSRGKDKQEQ